MSKKKTMTTHVDTQTGEMITQIPETRWRTPYNHLTKPIKREVNTLPSETVPDQALTVSQIIKRFAQGVPISASVRQLVYNGEIDIPDYEKLDLSERQEAILQAKQQIKRIEQALKDQFEAQQEKRQDANYERFKKEQELLDKKLSERLKRLGSPQDGKSEDSTNIP